MVDLLLEYKVDINAPDQYGRTTLHVLANVSYCSTYIVDYPVSKGADINLLNKMEKHHLTVPTTSGHIHLDLASKG